ncbi:hypothetical protein SEA_IDENTITYCRISIS_39 [Mycobacterium phage IdentityCrisis]|uniref:Uncharacterized protein n=1 Tax=Mycobacterium phage IdentityCrisis TaxID=2599866 RepID=A0A5J6TI28_9CAUD|nr:hypothetical protein QEH37_gp38 [Mycobacterium phage IdentityCrisis]QFG10058.1 hypothetical protein SEA_IDENTITYCRISIS_39 [Mycobacterium phage IdentityCrisis]
MSATTIEQNPQMSDEDVDAWSDMLYMRDLTDALEDEASRQGVAAMPQLSRFASSLLAYALALADEDMPPWNTDRAGELLDAWHNENPAVAA